MIVENHKGQAKEVGFILGSVAKAGKEGHNTEKKCQCLHCNLLILDSSTLRCLFLIAPKHLSHIYLFKITNHATILSLEIM